MGNELSKPRTKAASLKIRRLDRGASSVVAAEVATTPVALVGPAYGLLEVWVFSS